MDATVRNREVPCPDPSAHDQHNKLSEQASSAALYVTDPARGTEPRENALGPDGKLSSRSAAASLKYARAQDLPSFPSHGLNNADSAGKAAMLAKDYKMKDLWHPEKSSAGSKAALLAHKDGGKLDLWQPTASKDGNSAAALAMRSKGLSPELDRGYTEDGKRRALLAATLSVSRSSAAPVPTGPAAYPDSKNAGFNALNAATTSHRANSIRSAPDKRQTDGWNSDAMQAARVKNLGANMNPEMFGEHPPVEIEQEEKRHNAALRASAVSMAKQMYDYQNRTVLGPDLTGGVEGADAAAARQQPSTQIDFKQEALRYIHLQDAAHKLAQERLAKIDKTFEAAKYREYYGYPDEPQSPQKSMPNRLSMRSRGRRRAASDGDLDDSDDEQQARKIRHQMSQLNTGLNSVDDKKRSDDRAKLLAAAEKKVHAQMNNMDEKVFAETGKVPPAMMEQWEAKARERAQEEKKMQAQHQGQTHIGGGKFIDTSEIEAIAAARLKPTLDEINETAEKRRARDQEVKEQKEDQERTKREEKVKQREEKEESRRVKNEEKAAKKQGKEETKARKSEDKRKSREIKRESGGVVMGDEADEATDRDEPEAAKTDKKRSGTLGRITSRLRRGKKGGEDPAVETENETTPTAAIVGSTGAAAGGLAAADTAGNVEPGNTAKTAEAPVKDEDADSDVPEYGPHPAIAVPVAAPATDSFDDHDADKNVGLLASRPNLEQHYSHIGYSSDEDEGEDFKDAFGRADEMKHADELAEKGKRHFGYGEAAAVGGGAGAGVAGVPVLDPEHRATDGNVNPCEDGSGLHQTLTANRLDPNVQPDAAVANDRSVGGETEPASSTIGPHSSNVANIVDPRVQPDRSKQDTRKPGDETGPASDTIGPHRSNIANVVDPRVKPEPNKLKAREKQAEGKSAASRESTTEKEGKGLRGFLSKFKKDRSAKEPGKISSGMRHGSASDGKQSSEASAPATGAATAVSVQPGPGTTGGHAAQIGTDGPIGEPSHISGVGGDPRAVSPSSFRRRSDDLNNLSDVSSSGLEEEDLERGREARDRSKGKGKTTLTQKLGLGGKGEERETDDEDEEQFEEARDHFDEGLAPPPAFGGQAKSGSPVRETRFKEDV